MDKGHVFILNYIKNLEDQVLCDNYDAGRWLTKNTEVVKELLNWMFYAKNVHEINKSAYEKYKAFEEYVLSPLPDPEVRHGQI